MLDPKAISVAIALTQDYSNRGISISCVPDTPMSMICRETPMDGVLIPEKFDFESGSKMLLELSRCPEHAAAFAEIKILAIGGVRNTLDFTRNTVNPHIRKVIDAYAAVMEGSDIVPLPYNVEYYYLPEVFQHSAGREYVEGWENSPQVSSPGLVNLGAYEFSEIESLAKLTDDGGFNDLLAELLADDDSAGYKAIYEVLSGRTDVNNIDVNFTLPLAIVVRNIEVPKQGVTMNAEQYGMNRSLVANVAAKRALKTIIQNSHSTNTMALYRGAERATNGVIKVNGDVYSEMLDRGLTIEALIGNEIVGRKFYGKELLEVTNIEFLTEAYERDRAVRQRAHVADLQRRSRQAIQSTLRDDLNQIATAGNFVIETDSQEKAWSRLRSFMDSLFKNEFANYEPTSVIAAAVCYVWYSHTDAARFIDILFDVESRNKGMDKKELATLATLQYLCSWVLSQLTCSKPDA
jgi:hypothetical protein